MIQSMTGYGVAEHVGDGASYTLELRSLNNRYLKLVMKLPEPLQFLESDLDRLLRSRLGRGSVTLSLRKRSEADLSVRPINVEALQHYVDQLSKVSVPAGAQATIDLGILTTMPGICELSELDDQARSCHRETISELASRAIDGLVAMRKQEGEALHKDLQAVCGAIRKQVAAIEARAPHVVEEYHERLRTRVQTLLGEAKLELEADALMREVAVYADRCDISEEIARLASHLDQFLELCERGERVGRTLDFLTQELLREANTIASKSGDTVIARSVVEIKGLIDRLREQVQNVE